MECFPCVDISSELLNQIEQAFISGGFARKSTSKDITEEERDPTWGKDAIQKIDSPKKEGI
jgi:hypothetical protein